MLASPASEADSAAIARISIGSTGVPGFPASISAWARDLTSDALKSRMIARAMNCLAHTASSQWLSPGKS
jgi:hypothetical protein